MSLNINSLIARLQKTLTGRMDVKLKSALWDEKVHELERPDYDEIKVKRETYKAILDSKYSTSH